jgi:hypothetical protein
LPDRLRQPLPAAWIARLIGAIATLAVLCLPALHAAHLALADGHAGHAHVDHGGHAHPHGPTSEDRPPTHHDAAHCAICLSFGSIDAGAALFDLSVACAFDAPAAFPPPLYVAPPADAFVSTVAVPRGPPALAPY